MDVTPRELRDIEIREGFRGYNRDDVDELLERAAATIESLQERVRQVTDRVAEVESRAGGARETEDMLQRTLVLAQRAADEAVTEAQVKARAIIDDAESRARTTLADAETNARRLAEGERRRLEAEVMDLGARREALLADVDALERFESDYRSRLRRAIETDLEALTTSREPVAPGPRPAMHDVDVPATTPITATPPAPQPVPVAAAPVDPGPATMELSQPLAPSVPAQPPGAEVPPAPVQAAPRAGLFDEDAPALPDTLDDEAFFASLRDAVRDDAPLGPRDDELPERRIFDEDDPARRQGIFKRRR